MAFLNIFFFRDAQSSSDLREPSGVVRGPVEINEESCCGRRVVRNFQPERQFLCEVDGAGIIAPVAFEQFSPVLKKIFVFFGEAIAAVFTGYDYAKRLSLQTVSLFQDSHRVFGMLLAGVREKGFPQRLSEYALKAYLFPE